MDKIEIEQAFEVVKNFIIASKVTPIEECYKAIDALVALQLQALKTIKGEVQ